MPTLRLLSIIQGVIPRQKCLKLVFKQLPRYEENTVPIKFLTTSSN